MSVLSDANHASHKLEYHNLFINIFSIKCENRERGNGWYSCIL